MQLLSLKYKNYLIPVLLVPIVLSIYMTQTYIERHKGIEQRIEKVMFLPKGEYLKPAVIGYEQLVGDILWLHAIQVIGDKVVTPQGYDWAYHALDIVTTLDPKFAYAYQLGGVTLSALGNRPDLSNMLLEKGVRENPEVWQIPFYMGFNNFFYLNNYAAAAEYMDKASKLPGHPAYLPKLAARLYVQAGNPDVALEFLNKMSHEAKDEKVQSALEQMIKEIIIERDASLLEKAISQYKETYKIYPDQLTELVKTGFIQEIPSEPFGGYYYFNQNDGKVHSNIVTERMRVYGKVE